MSRRNPFPNVTRSKDRHGTVRWRYRKRGFSCYLSGVYGSVEFIASYESAVSGVKSDKTERFKRGSFDWLISQYFSSPKFLNRAVSSRRQLRSEFEWIRGLLGKLPYSKMETRNVEQLMAKKTGPAASNKVKKNLSTLFNYAIKHSYHTHNPAKYADRYKENPDGYHTWTDAEITQFLAYHGPKTKPRLALLVFLCTGAATQDAAKLGKQHVLNGRIKFRRGKTGVTADLLIQPELQVELDHLPNEVLLFITHSQGRGYSARTLGQWFKSQCKAAGLNHCSAHGLRKSGATQLADAGGTPDEIRAFMAHKTNEEGKTYTKQADRARLADSAFEKLKDSKHEQNVSNLKNRLDKIERN